MNKNRKYIFILLILLFLTITPAFSNQLIVPGERIGKIKLGMDFSEVKKILGDPDRSPTTTGDGLTEYRYMKSHALIIDVDPKTQQVKMIATGLVSTYKTSEGLTVGSSDKNVENSMGKSEIIKLGTGSYTLKYPQKGIEFILREKAGIKSVFVILIRQKR